MTGGLPNVFTQKIVVNNTFIMNSSKICKSFVGIGASQLFPYSMCQNMSTGLHTRWDFGSDMQKTKAIHNLFIILRT